MQAYEHIAMSFGAGVQSTAMLLLVLKEPERAEKIFGQLPNGVYFADPGAESESIYKHLEAMQRLTESTKDAPFFRIVRRGSILDPLDLNLRGYARGLSTLPLFTLSPSGKKGMLSRKCTSEYKIKPLQKAIRAECGFKPRSKHPHAVGLWLGISTDEASRMTHSKVQWMDNLYPLIELGWSRKDCYDYCLSHGVIPSKSRCYFCPFTADWAVVKAKQPLEFAKAVEFDKLIRNSLALSAETFLHRSCKPLEEAVLLKEGFDYDGFDSECSGHCGV
jgi:3'-phosphoadenosine 5'-phosphosulfate sulfotransferase (PAPS reductase)/FAD synthetase